MNAIRESVKVPRVASKFYMGELPLSSRRGRVLILGGDQLAKELGADARL